MSNIQRQERRRTKRGGAENEERRGGREEPVEAGEAELISFVEFVDGFALDDALELFEVAHPGQLPDVHRLPLRFDEIWAFRSIKNTINKCVNIGSPLACCSHTQTRVTEARP